MNSQDKIGVIAPSSLSNAFTVDLEEWFQGLTSTNPQVGRWPELESRVVGATGRLLNLLQKYQVTATFFVLGHVADHHPGLIEQIAAAGHELGIHGYYHRFVTRLTPAGFAQEIEMSLTALQKITGRDPLGHRAPYFSINQHTPWAFEILARYGLVYDSSVFPVRSLLYGQPNAPRFPYLVPTPAGAIHEMPVSTVRLGGVNWPMGGGFYLRLLPYRLVRWAIRHLNRQGRPAILYTHPWELDSNQPRHRPITPRERLSHYYGRQALAAKLEQLFSDFKFSPLAQLLPNATEKNGK